MKFTLITAKGKVYTFFINAVAETYQQAYGGTLITGSILTKETQNETLSYTNRNAQRGQTGRRGCAGWCCNQRPIGLRTLALHWHRSLCDRLAVSGPHDL